MRRPLDRVGSIKLKLGVVIVAAVGTTVVILELGWRMGWPTLPVAVAAGAVALAMVQLLAHGMTFPLREMARAASRLAAGHGHEPVTATSRDEVGELARAFNHMAAQLAETDQVRRDLVANVSHELRTPIAAMRAVLENLVDGVEDVDAATLDRLLRQTERLQSLVEGLLDLSRLEARVTHLQFDEVVAADLLHEVVELVSPVPGAPVATELEPSDLRFPGDGRRLVQVLVNLVTNARQHAPDDTQVRVVATQVGESVELAVVDAGPGIDPGDTERIFERFQRSGSGGSRVDASGGSGLGLAISRSIVELHGGRIAVDRDHRPGCRMVVTLPMQEDRDDG